MKIKIASKIFELEEGSSAYDALKAAEMISKEVIASRVNSTVTALTHKLQENDTVEPITFADDEGKRVFRHTASHILAQAVKRLYPQAKLTIGPAVDNGFYYDFDSEITFGATELAAIEKEMTRIVKENLKIERFVLPREEALALVKEMNEPYKVLLIERIPEGEEVSFYRQGDFVDLCAGPHLFATGAVKAVKLTVKILQFFMPWIFR